jgi:hypothetical protein
MTSTCIPHFGYALMVMVRNPFQKAKGGLGNNPFKDNPLSRTKGVRKEATKM